MNRRRLLIAGLCAAPLGAALGAAAWGQDDPAPEDPAASGRLILGLSEDGPLAELYAEAAAGGAEVAPDSALGEALAATVGLPLAAIRLGSGRTVSFEIDWAALGAERSGQELLLTLPDSALAGAVASRLDPVAREAAGRTLTLDPARTAAALADWLSGVDFILYAQVDRLVTIER